ncbi:citron Rho-interacting kinase-like [Harmonia axyridis]|uniref:citron Rho-interacting kinase-like n=1 Tax=Harmonia axyridis TaxID=115357 RepID=UPI001E2790DD|nr:citron Rho-interacting kinase-like [Harmonia axyridis]
MEDTIDARVARLNSEILGKKLKTDANNLITREGLFDSLQALYDECSIENIQKSDKNIEFFVKTYKKTMDDLKMTRINLTDFEIRNCIGRGHFGDVHVVVEKHTKDIYAMKSIRKCDSLDQNKTSFIEERNIMAFSNSPWLTSLQYAFQDKTHLFFVMEFHPGGDLLGLLMKQGGTIPESAAVFYLSEILLGLKDLHKMGYVHRDIKPDNILLDRCGHVKLADFGSAAKLDASGFVTDGPPVGTPDYVAPEILEALENKTEKKVKYGISCDFWSLGVLAYELTIGNSPFTGQSTSTIYMKIMNHKSNLKFPSDALLSEAYVSLIKNLVTDQKERLSMEKIFKHSLFKRTLFDTLRDQVPPFVPKISSFDDTSNFSDVPPRKKIPSIENFKKRTQFSGRNLPFIGFTFTPFVDSFDTSFNVRKVKDEIVENLKGEVEKLRRKLAKNENFSLEKENLEKKLDEKTRKLEGVEILRNQLEKDVANNLAECTALRRTLELERKDRIELEKKAMDLIKSAKLKWETEEKRKMNALDLIIDEQKVKISQLCETNKILEDQLQHAQIMEEKHRISLETSEKLTRKSVVGLQSRLETVTSETQNRISDLQGRLNEQLYQKNALERQISDLKDKENKLTLKVRNYEENQKALNEQINIAESLIRELEDKVTTYEKQQEKLESYTQENNNLREKRNNDKKLIKDLENRCILLELENKKLEGLKPQIGELNNKIKELEIQLKKSGELEVQLQREREKTKSLTKQIQEAENNLSEAQELKEVRTKYWKMEKELNNLKIDKRILERELKESEAQNKELAQEIESMKEQKEKSKKKYEDAMLEMNSINDSISMELMKMKESNKSLLVELKAQKKINEETKDIVSELKAISNSKEEKIKQLNVKLENCVKNAQKSLTEKEDLLKKIEEHGKIKKDLENEVKCLREQKEDFEANISEMRSALKYLDETQEEITAKATSLKDENKLLKTNSENLLAELRNAKREIQEAKKLANEEKSFKLIAENKLQRLKDETETIHHDLDTYKHQTKEYKDYSNKLSEELTSAEEKLTDLRIKIRSFERENQDLQLESTQLKEELSDYLTQLHKCRESKLKMKHRVNELEGEVVMLQQQCNELEMKLQERTATLNANEIKSKEIIKQQQKLIDLLHARVDEQPKKRNYFLFGGSKKENTPPISLSLNYKDLELELKKEKASNKALQEEIFKLKAESSQKVNDNCAKQIANVSRHKSDIVSPKSKIAMQKLVQSPSSQIKDKQSNKSGQRMHHRIPHRFSSRLCHKLVKCAFCQKNITLGSHWSYCKECNIIVHPHCSSSVANTCGLPSEFVHHFKTHLDSPVILDKEQKEIVDLRGYLKMPGKNNTWEQRYCILKEDKLEIYPEEPKNNSVKILETVDLKLENSCGKIDLEPQPSEIDISVAKSDVPFLMRIEVTTNTTCWPPRYLIFLMSSHQDKEKWYLGFQRVFMAGNEKLYTKTIMSVWDDKIVVNCIVDLTEGIKLLGTQKGLQAFYNNTLIEIRGFKEVHYIAKLEETKSLVMIVNPSNVVAVCDLGHVINVVQCTAGFALPTVKYDLVRINNLEGFHFLEASKKKQHKMFCVANPKVLAIVGYVDNEKEFVPLRLLDTAEPTNTVLFTDHSIIVGADKFFEIDINTFKAEEFLDTSNPKMKQVLKCYELESYPISIVEVSENPREYLVAFNEFFIFVDEFGSPSRRREWTTSHLPLAITYIKPFLYIIGFTAVEIHEIKRTTCDEEEDSLKHYTRLGLDKFQFVGTTKTGVYLWHDKCIKLLEGRRFQSLPESSSEDTASTIEDNSDRFSFSSSIVRTLDDLQTEDEDLGAREKVVTFAQTSL